MARHHLHAADSIRSSHGYSHKSAALARRHLHLSTASLRSSIRAAASVLHRCCLERHCSCCFCPRSEQGTELRCSDFSLPPLCFQPFAAANTSQQPQLHLSSWSLFTDFIGVGNVYGRGQLRMLRSSPAGLASLSPYLLLHLSSCFLCQVARSSVDIFTAYAQSMPAGIAAVIGANGALFKY
jgi:hypothetical protein